MMHITEDTPPDMLAGAMDLTIHLPTGRTVKMSVERRYRKFSKGLCTILTLTLPAHP